MKAEFELSLDSNNRPCIKFKHHDKDLSLDQEVLKTFIEAAGANGLVIVYKNGYTKSGSNESWGNFEIQIKTQ